MTFPVRNLPPPKSFRLRSRRLSIPQPCLSDQVTCWGDFAKDNWETLSKWSPQGQERLYGAAIVVRLGQDRDAVTVSNLRSLRTSGRLLTTTLRIPAARSRIYEVSEWQ
jgi:hypothetical protein